MLGTKFGFKYRFTLSTRSKEKKAKYLGTDKDWNNAKNAIKKALGKLKIKFNETPGEAKFYGPSLDVQIKDSLGREWQCSTIQFDFNVPERFDVTYVDKEGKKVRPFMIHRALMGSMERFFGVLIEHYAGAFPLWLAPIQVKVMTITDKSLSYAEQVADSLSSQGMRIELDKRNEKINLKVREAEKEKIPYMAIVGEREEKEHSISVRERHRKNRGSMTVEAFLNELQEKCSSKILS